LRKSKKSIPFDVIVCGTLVPKWDWPPKRGPEMGLLFRILLLSVEGIEDLLGC
jgi:hypothetical protein